MDKIIKLNLQNYLSIKKMFESPDGENKDVAVALITQLDIKTNLVYIMMLMKETKMGYDWWYRTMGTEFINTLNNTISNKKNICFLSYTDILNLGVAYNVPVEDIEFIINRQVWYTLYKYTPLVHPHIADVELKLITHEERSISKSM